MSFFSVNNIHQLSYSKPHQRKPKLSVWLDTTRGTWENKLSFLWSGGINTNWYGCPVLCGLLFMEYCVIWGRQNWVLQRHKTRRGNVGGEIRMSDNKTTGQTSHLLFSCHPPTYVSLPGFLLGNILSFFLFKFSCDRTLIVQVHEKNTLPLKKFGNGTSDLPY